MNGGIYKLLNSKGETVGTAYVEHAGPLSRWGWFAHVNGFTASNGCPLETSKQAFEELEETMSGHGLFVGLTARPNKNPSRKEGVLAQSGTDVGTFNIFLNSTWP